jgi:hypothetical protein
MARQPSKKMSKLYTLFLLMTSLFAMAALGMLILVAITEVSRLAMQTPIQGMNR